MRTKMKQTVNTWLAANGVARTRKGEYNEKRAMGFRRLKYCGVHLNAVQKRALQQHLGSNGVVMDAIDLANIRAAKNIAGVMQDPFVPYGFYDGLTIVYKE